MAQSRCFHLRKNLSALCKHMLCIGAVHWHLVQRLSLPGFGAVWCSPLSEGNVQAKFCVTQSLLVESCGDAINPAWYICAILPRGDVARQ